MGEPLAGRLTVAPAASYGHAGVTYLEVIHISGWCMAAERITAATVTPVAFPDPPLLNSVGVHQPWALRAIVQLAIGTELTGLGESYGDQPHLALLRQVASRLPGHDPFDLPGLAAVVAQTVGDTNAPDVHGLTGLSTVDTTMARVYAAFEVACLDLQGRLIGRPVHALLGGKVRAQVPYSGYLFYKWAGHPGAEPDPWGAALDPAGIVAQARRMVSEYGFGSLKLKGGVFPPDQEIAAIQALRTEFPAAPLRLDPNAVWSVPTSIGVAEQTADLLEYLEDPTGGIPAMAEVAAAAPMPLATNMCVVTEADLAPAIEQRAVGVVLADHHFWGGAHGCLRLAAVCAAFGLGVSMHSNSHLGISLAAMTHVAAATAGLTYACDTHTPWQAGIDVVTEPLPITGGTVAVPDRPGLGVDVDPDALARLHENYLRCGITHRDDAGYRRQVEPGYEAPRW
jgi:glucarate dehydratase